MLSAQTYVILSLEFQVAGFFYRVVFMNASNTNVTSVHYMLFTFIASFIPYNICLTGW